MIAKNGGTLLHTGDTYSPNLMTSKTFWILASDNGCTTGTRTAVTATVNSVTVDTPASDSFVKATHYRLLPMEITLPQPMVGEHNLIQERSYRLQHVVCVCRNRNNS